VSHWSGCLCVFGVKRWVVISGRGRGGDRAIVRVSVNLDLYELDCCHELTCCFITKIGQSLGPANLRELQRRRREDSCYMVALMRAGVVHWTPLARIRASYSAPLCV